MKPFIQKTEGLLWMYRAEETGFMDSGLEWLFLELKVKSRQGCPWPHGTALEQHFSLWRNRQWPKDPGLLHLGKVGCCVWQTVGLCELPCRSGRSVPKLEARSIPMKNLQKPKMEREKLIAEVNVKGWNM